MPDTNHSQKSAVYLFLARTRRQWFLSLIFILQHVEVFNYRTLCNVIRRRQISVVRSNVLIFFVHNELNSILSEVFILFYKVETHEKKSALVR